ncbi:MAG: glycosyltransferase family 39 protein [Dehalococcoidia bacterium]
MTKPAFWALEPSALHNDRLDALIAGMLLAATIVTRVPFRTTVLFNWDSANFALATRFYDVTQHHPHPPGYLLYVAVANLLLPLTGDANAALVSVSLILSAFAPPLTYLLGAALFNRLTGIAGGLFVLTSVTFWSYGGIALAYPALALFSAWVAWSAYRTAWQGDRGAWLPLAIGYGLGAGFRPDLALFLGPIFLAGLSRLGRRRAAAALAVAGGCVLAWLVPTVALSGGPREYWAVLSAYADRDVLDRYASTRGGLSALFFTVRDLVSYTWYSLYALVLPLAAGAVLVVVRRPRPSPRWLFFALWLTPMLLFYVFVHIGDPGYVFIFLPALAVLAGLAVVELALALRPIDPVALAGVAIVVIALANTAIFLGYPRLLTAQGVRASDRQLAAKLEYVRALPNDETILLLSYESYRHLQYYLPDRTASLWVDPFAPTPTTTALSPRTRWLVLVDNRLAGLAGNRLGAELIDGVAMTRVPVEPGQALTFGAGKLSLD